MHGQGDAKPIARLAARWTRVVEGFADGSGAGRLSPAGYQSLRSELVRQARDLAAQSDSPEQALFRELGELAAPWVTLESLARAHPQLLRNVVDSVENLQARLDRRSPRKARNRWRIAMMAAAAAIFVPSMLFVVRESSLSTVPGEAMFQQLWWHAAQRWIVAAANFLNRCGTAEFAVILGLGEVGMLAPLLWFSRDRW